MKDAVKIHFDEAYDDFMTSMLGISFWGFDLEEILRYILMGLESYTPIEEIQIPQLTLENVRQSTSNVSEEETLRIANLAIRNLTYSLYHSLVGAKLYDTYGYLTHTKFTLDYQLKSLILFHKTAQYMLPPTN
jgi:hypothetical protein